jgi:hypothetical protein
MKAETSKKPRGGDGRPVPPRSEPVDLSWPLEVGDIPPKGLEVTIRAEEAACRALARRGGLVAVESLTADFSVRKAEASKVAVSGVLRARIVQTCVVSLDPFECDVTSKIETDFAGPSEIGGGPHERFAALDDRSRELPGRGAELDAPDPIIDGRIDLGALAAEFLMLSLDPYPRKPGVSFDAGVSSGGDAEPDSPFAALGKLWEKFDRDG